MRMKMFSTLCLLAALVGTAQAKDPPKTPTKGLRYASLTPDQKRVVFCYRGDIWVGSRDGKGPVTRLTIHEAQDTLARVSPDGKQVAFTSRRFGNYDLFVMSIEGGMPRRITFHSGFEAICGWSPDGKSLLFTSERAGGRGRTDLYEVNLSGGTPRRITFDGGRDGAYSKDGSRIVYTRGFNSIYWDNYTGSANFDIYVVDRAGGTPRRITRTKGNERWPLFSADGKTIYFLAEEKGVRNFYSMPVEGGKRSRITAQKGADCQRPNLGWDYKTVVFERVGRLFTTDLTNPKSKPVPLNISIRSDVRNSGIETRTITTGGEHFHVSRDGRSVAFTLRGDIWVMPAAGGRGRRITSGPSKDEWPRFSPDGTQIAYQTSVGGNSDIVLLDLKSKKTRPLTTSRANDFFHNWSPDGSTLVFCSERSGNRDIWLLDVKSGTKTQVTTHTAGDDDPSFSPDGKLIAFDSAREGTQAIYVMRRDGTGVRRVTRGTGFHQVPSFSPDGSMLVYESFVPAGGRSGGLFVVSVNGGPSMMISRDGQGACWRGDHIYFGSNRGHAGNGAWRVKAPSSVEAGERIPFIGSVEVDRRKELATLFDEAWTALKNGFYDPRMHGVDWKKMKTKYRAMAIDSENKDEFQNIIRQMLAELGASHLGIFGGQPTSGSAAPKVVPTGYLGLDFEQVPLKEGGRRVRGILAGGPADRAGIRVGDVVTRLGTRKLKAKTNLDKVMTGTVDKTLPVTFKPRSESGLGPERTAPVTPVAFSSIRSLQYKAWIAQCARRVKQATKESGGEVVYLHLNAMNPKNLAKFQQSVARWNRSKKVKGMILDVRDNGGGNIHNQLMSVLWAKPLARVTVRNGPSAVQPALYWDRPIVLLINERSFSDAEVFPYMFKAAGIGKVVGVPTAGGVIGTQNITLSDGSQFRIPRTGFRGMDGKNLEGLGVQPDSLVEETAEDRLTGRDPQLAKAIALIKAEVAERAKQRKAERAKAKAKAKAKQKAKPKAKPPAKPQVPVKVPASGVEPLLDARVGEWVRFRYREPGAEGETIFKITVSAIEEGMIVISKELEKGGLGVPPLPLRLRQTGLLEALRGFGKLESSFEVDGRVGEKPAKLLRADLLWPDGSKLQFTFTNAVPVYGLLKIELNKVVILEAIEWGAPVGKVEAKAAEKEAEEAEKLPTHPLWDAKEGEWVKRRRKGPQPGQEFEIVYRITEVDEEEIVIAQTIFVQGREIKGPTRRRKRDKELKPPAKVGDAKSYGSEEITIGEQTLKCITMTAEDPRNGKLIKWYFCPEVPVDGIVRVEVDGQVISEAVEWGTDDD